MNTSELTIGENIFALFKGDPKTRKSTAAASFPTPYFIDVDRRIRALIKAWPNKTFDFIQPTSFNEMHATLSAALKNVYSKETATAEAYLEGVYGSRSSEPDMDRFKHNFKWETYVLDSLTSIGKMILSLAVQERGGKTKLKVAGIEANEIEDYGAEYRGLCMLLDLMAIMPCHRILIAHILTKVDTELRKGVGKTTIETRTLVTGGTKIASVIPTYFDEVYHFSFSTPITAEGQSADTHYYALTSSDGMDWASSALPLPQKIDWTGKSFYDELMKYVAKERNVIKL